MNIDNITALFGIDVILAAVVTSLLAKVYGTDTGQRIIDLKAQYDEFKLQTLAKYEAIESRYQALVDMGRDGFDAGEIKIVKDEVVSIREGIQEILSREGT